MLHCSIGESNGHIRSLAQAGCISMMVNHYSNFTSVMYLSAHVNIQLAKLSCTPVYNVYI